MYQRWSTIKFEWKFLYYLDVETYLTKRKRNLIDFVLIKINWEKLLFLFFLFLNRYSMTVEQSDKKSLLFY